MPRLAARALLEQAGFQCAGETHAVLTAAVERLIDYQDARYAREFLTRLQRFQAIEERATAMAAAGCSRKWRASSPSVWLMRILSGSQTLRFRPSRFARVRDEAQLAPGQDPKIVEFFHPRVQEIADTLPASIGRWLLAHGLGAPACRAAPAQG